MEPEHEICTKMLKKLSEKLEAKFPATTPDYSMEKKLLVSMTLSRKIFKLKASPVEVQSLKQK